MRSIEPANRVAIVANVIRQGGKRRAIHRQSLEDSAYDIRLDEERNRGQIFIAWRRGNRVCDHRRVLAVWVKPYFRVGERIRLFAAKASIYINENNSSASFGYLQDLIGATPKESPPVRTIKRLMIGVWN
jgi:hypothetical protein